MTGAEAPTLSTSSETPLFAKPTPLERQEAAVRNLKKALLLVGICRRLLSAIG